jgi:hypothetical protein
MAAINNMIRKYGALDAVFGQEQYAQIPMAVVGIVMKFFQIVISVVIGMAAGCIPVVGYQHGRRADAARPRAVFPLLKSEALVGAAALVLVEVFPGSSSHFRRRERERLLHGFCREGLPHLSVHDDLRLHQQGLLHLPAGDGQGAGIHAAFGHARGGFRRRLCAAAAALLRAGRRAVLHAAVGYPDFAAAAFLIRGIYRELASA